MTWADIRTRTRRDVHRTFAVPCVLTTADGTFTLNVRLHGRMVLGGDIDGEAYATIIEGVSRVIFNREDLALLAGGLGVKPVRGDRVVFPDYFGPGQDAALELDARDQYDGTIVEKWTVAQFNKTTASQGTMAGVGLSDGEFA